MQEHIDLTDAPDWVPEDTFGIRLAMVRAVKHWNVLKAATVCGLDPSTWTNWERGIHKPQDYEMVCRKIAGAVGCDLQWLANGGPLPVRSRWTSPSALRLIPGGQDDSPAPGQMIPLALPLFTQIADN